MPAEALPLANNNSHGDHREVQEGASTCDGVTPQRPLVFVVLPRGSLRSAEQHASHWLSFMVIFYYYCVCR